MRSSRSQLLAVVAFLSLQAACSSDDEIGADPPGTEPMLDQVEHAAEAVAALSPRSFTLEEAIALLDVNGDGRVDPRDRAALDACLDDGDDGGRCDITGDGEISEADRIAFTLLLGDPRPRPPEEIRAVAQAHREVLAADLDPSIVDLSQGDDYDGDGETTTQDIRIFADALERMADDLIDLDGNDALDLGDVTVLARQAVLAERGGSEPNVDVNGDGRYTSHDLVLLADLAMFTNLSSYGILDHDNNGRIDVDDFCLTSTITVGEKLAAVFAAPGAQRDEIAAVGARSMFCRGDGRALQYARPRGDQQMQSVVIPDGLFLERVDAPPANLGVPESDYDAESALYVVTQQATERLITQLTLPMPAADTSDRMAQFSISGSPVEAEAVLLVHGTALPLSPMQPRAARLVYGNASPPSGSGEQRLETPLHDLAVSEGHLASRAEFKRRLDEIVEEYEALMAQCPCAESNRLEFVSRLNKMIACLRATEKVAGDVAARIDAAFREAYYEFLDLNGAAIESWYEYSRTIVDMEVASTLLLVAETLYDGARGGPAGALAGALGNFASEYASKAAPGCEGPIGEFGKGIGLDQAAGPLGAFIGELSDWLVTAARERGSRLGAQEFASQFRDIASQAGSKVARELGPKAVESLIKSLIKAIPKFYVYYVKVRAHVSEAHAKEAYDEYIDLRRQRGSFEHGAEDLGAAVEVLQELQGRLTRKLQEDGCPVSLVRDAPCDVDLDLALGAAEAELASALADAETEIAQATGSSSEVWHEQSEHQRVEQASSQVRGTANRLRSSFDRGGSGEVLETLAEELTSTLSDRFETQASLAAVCAIFTEETTVEELQRIRDARDAIDAALDAFEAAVKAALEAYEACVESGGGFGSCGFDAEEAQEDPWAAGASCLGCLPPHTADCCGDGRLQDGEQCDPAMTPNSCGTGTCTDACVCEGGVALDEPAMTADPVGDIIDSVSSNTPGRSSPSIDIVSFGATTMSLSADDVDTFFGSSGMYPCNSSVGMTLIFCPPGVAPIPAGDVVRVVTVFDGVVPTADAMSSYIYSVVFDSDGDPATNWQYVPPYDWDLFRDADRWYQLSYGPMANWGVSVSQVSAGSPPQPTAAVTGSTARAILDGNRVEWFISLSELPAGGEARYRPTSFIHDGMWTQMERGADVGGANPTEPLFSFDP